jgi:hypothetical protein
VLSRERGSASRNLDGLRRSIRRGGYSLIDEAHTAVSLTPLTTPAKSHKIAVYDLEWIPETYELTLAGFDDGERYVSFPTIERLLNHVMQPKYRAYKFYAHAGGLADMHFLLEKLVQKPNIRVDASFSGSSAIVVKARWGGSVYTFYDSYWLFRDKLAHLSKFTGIEKNRGVWKCASFPACGHVGRVCADAPGCGCSTEPEPLCIFRAPYSILRDYNERDCRILYRAIVAFQEELLEMGGELRSTIASTALSFFRRVYLRDPIATSPVMNDALRAAYISSRVEPFREVLDSPASYYDINSSFPFAMTQPCPGEHLSTGATIPDTDAPFFARAVVSVPEMFLPPLGARGKDDRIFFPTGSWRGLFSAPDLRLLESVGGRIESVEECHVYHSFTDLACYALDLYERRLKAKKAGQSFRALVLKYLLNSCYGKFGEHREKTSMRVHPHNAGCPHGGAHETLNARGEMSASCIEQLFSGVDLVTEEKSIPHEHVPIAAHITSLARATLYKYLAMCGEDLYYTDTDSIVTGQTLPVGDALGELKKEYDVTSGRFIQPKLYEIDGHVKSKGFSRLTSEQFQALVSGQEIRVERMYRVKELAREQGRFGPVGKTFDKRIRLGMSRPKRQADATGGTRPWTYEETQQRWKGAT